MKLDAFKHLELCSDCQEKINQRYFTTAKNTLYDIRQRGGIYFVEYKDEAGKRKRTSLKTRDKATANIAAFELVSTVGEELGTDAEDYKNLSKYEQGKPYHVNQRTDSKSGIWYMCWFDGKKSIWKSTKTTDKELAEKVAAEMWRAIKA